MKIHRGKAHGREYHDEDKLRELYHGEGMSQAEIADHFDTTRTTIQNAINNTDIELRKSNGDPTKPPHHSFLRRDDRPIGTCEERISTWIDGGNKTVKIHRLIAVAHGLIDPSDMWDEDLKVHHKSGHGLDNRPDNLEVVTQEEHREKHAGSPYRTTTE
jgi:hypothetical protein